MTWLSWMAWVGLMLGLVRSIFGHWPDPATAHDLFSGLFGGGAKPEAPLPSLSAPLPPLGNLAPGGGPVIPGRAAGGQAFGAPLTPAPTPPGLSSTPTSGSANQVLLDLAKF